MSLPVALLLFWLRPSAAVRALAGRHVAFLLVLFPPALLLGWLRLRGCTLPDALAAAGALALATSGLAIGGMLAAGPAARLTGAAWSLRARFGACGVAAAWASLLPVPLLLGARLLGAGSAAGLVAGLALLLWGLAVARALLDAESESDGGRLFVAACFGVTGCLLGAYAAFVVAQSSLVLALPSPFESGQIRAGDYLLVRVERGVAHGTDPQAIHCLRAEHSREVVFARIDAAGARHFVGRLREDPEASRKWDIAGRVFFQLGGAHGGSVVGTEHSPNTR